jgi:CRP-like cAMP-binding protein
VNDNIDDKDFNDKDMDSFLSMEIPNIGGEFTTRTVSPGEFIFLEGQPGDAAYIVLKGEVQVVTQNPDGDYITLSTMTPGEMFGEIALLTAACVRTATTMSNSGCELVVVDRLAFETHLLHVDSMTRYIMSQFCKRVVALSERVRLAERAPAL